MLVRPESNSRPPAGQTVAQLTEPPVRGLAAAVEVTNPSKVPPNNKPGCFWVQEIKCSENENTVANGQNDQNHY